MFINSINDINNGVVKIAVLGSTQCGKSAVTVRFLTKRYISEYSSSRDFLYTHSVSFDDIIANVELLDTSSCKNAQCLYDHINWGNGFAVVYSVCDRNSFIQCQNLLETISVLKAPTKCPILILANKTDLADYGRQVDMSEGQRISVQYRCHFTEVSAAESSVGVTQAFQSLIRELLPTLVVKNLATVRRKTSSVITVSKMIGRVFRKNEKNNRNGKKKSLSI